MSSVLESRAMLAFSITVVLALGFGLPSVLVFLNVFYSLDILFVGFFTLLSLALGAASLTIMMESTRPVQSSGKFKEETDRFRESQIDILEDLDEILNYLSDVRNRLRAEE